MNKLEINDKLQNYRLPEGWKKVKLGEVIKEISFKVEKTTLKPVAIGVSGFRFRDELYYKELTNDYSNYKIFPYGYLAFGLGTNEIVCGVNLYKGEVYCVSPAYKVFHIESSDIIFFHHFIDYFKHIWGDRFLVISARQGKTLDFKIFLQESIFLPQLPEQQKIAEILENIDQTIEKTDAIIEKYKRIKQGLMQDLLTRGITAFEFEKDKLVAAVKKVFDSGDHRFGREENLVNHLSRHLEKYFPEWTVDNEVEKNNERQRPDIIVHKRGTDNNLFAIEVKKNDNLNAIKEDIKKLEDIMLGDYHYEDAIFIGFNTENFREIFKLSNRINYILVSQNGETMVKPRIRKFKYSPLGNTPEEWKVAKLREMATILLSNVDKKIFSQEIKVKLCNYLEVYKHDYIFKNINFSIGSVNIREYQKFRVDKGDVIITKDSEEFDDIAKSAYVEDEIEDLICGYHLCLIKPKINITAGQYLAMVLWFEKYNKQFQNKANGITRFGISKDTIESALLPLPSLPEQQRIALILSQMDEAIEEEQNYKEKLERIKQGLMEDLLTGEVRTNHLIKEGVESVQKT